MKLKLFYEGESITVTSEAAAKRWARKKLGAKRVYETPTATGWQYWTTKDENKEETPVTAIVM
jgi:hypothetical protein